MVLLHTGTNFPAVSVNSLLAVAMMKTRQRWNWTGVPIQSQPQTASLTLSTWNSQRGITPYTLQINDVISIRWWTLVSYLLRQFCPKTAECEGVAHQQGVGIQCLCQISAVFQTLQKRSSVECTVFAVCLAQFKIPKDCTYTKIYCVFTIL